MTAAQNHRFPNKFCESVSLFAVSQTHRLTELTDSQNSQTHRLTVKKEFAVSHWHVLPILILESPLEHSQVERPSLNKYRLTYRPPPHKYRLTLSSVQQLHRTISWGNKTCVCTASESASASYAVGAVFASTAGRNITASSVEGAVSVVIKFAEHFVRIAAEAAYVYTVCHVIGASNVEELVSVTMDGNAAHANHVEEPASASTGCGAVTASTAEEPASASTGGGGLVARCVEEEASVSMASADPGAYNAETKPHQKLLH